MPKKPLRYLNVFGVVPLPLLVFVLWHTSNDASKGPKLQVSKEFPKNTWFIHHDGTRQHVWANPPITLYVIFLFSSLLLHESPCFPCLLVLFNSARGAAIRMLFLLCRRLLCLSKAPPDPDQGPGHRRGTELLSSWEQSQNLPHFMFTQQWPIATERFCLCTIIKQVRNSPQNLLCKAACSHSSDSMIHWFIWLTGLIEGLKGPTKNQNQKKINPDTKALGIFLKLLLVGN